MLLEREAARARALLAQYGQIAGGDVPPAGKSLPREQVFAFLALDYGIGMTRQHLRWVEEAMARIGKGREEKKP